MNDKPLRIAVVGLGKMGLLHASILNTVPNVQLVAVCEKSSFSRKLLKKILPGILILEDVGEFSDLGLDAVYVTTPISSHFNVAKTVCQQRLARHLFVEKPLTSSYPESKELSELIARSRGVNMVGYLRRFMVTFMKTKDLLAQDIIGEPISFAINALSSDFFDVQAQTKASVARGGVLRDLGSYAVDMALWFFGDIGVSSAKVESLIGAGSEDAVHFAVHRESDALQGNIFVSWCAEGYRMPEVVLSIEGSKGTLRATDDKVSLNLRNGSSQTWHRVNLNDNVGFWLGAPEYYREDAYFVKSIKTGSVAEPSFKTASKVDLLIDVIHRKAESHD